MLELYAHDFSEFIDLKLGADGRFGYKHLYLYWKESIHFSLELTVISLALFSCVEALRFLTTQMFGIWQSSS